MRADTAGTSLLFINGAFNCPPKQKRNREDTLALVVYPWERELLHLSQITRVTILRVRDFVGILTNPLVASEKISRAFDSHHPGCVLRVASYTYRNYIREHFRNFQGNGKTDDDWS